jgi:hypothetical protein
MAVGTDVGDSGFRQRKHREEGDADEGTFYVLAPPRSISREMLVGWLQPSLESLLGAHHTNPAGLDSDRKTTFSVPQTSRISAKPERSSIRRPVQHFYNHIGPRQIAVAAVGLVLILLLSACVRRSPAISDPPPASFGGPTITSEYTPAIAQPAQTTPADMALNSAAGATSIARVYADVNANMPRAYWDYDSVNISWGVLENYEVVRKIGRHLLPLNSYPPV